MDRFDEILRARAQRWAPQGVVEQTAQHEVRITQPDGATTTVNVAPIAWQLADASDAEVAERVDRQLALLAEAAGSTPQTVPWQRLMPLLRSASFMTASAMRGQVVIEPVDDFLCVALGIDHSDGIQMVSKADLGRWSVGADQLFNAAFGNLRSQVGPQSFEFSDVDGERAVALLRGVAPYGYQTSLAFVGDLVRQLASGSGGAPPVVFFPSRNDLFVIPADRTDLLAAGFDEALVLYQQHPRPLVPVPYSYDARGLLVPWQPPAQLQDRFDRARAHLLHGEYEAQRRFFEQEPDGLAESAERGLHFLPVQARVTGQSWALLDEAEVARPDDDAPVMLLPELVSHVGFQVGT